MTIATSTQARRSGAGGWRTLAERAYDLIRQDIVAGRLVSGQKLRAEQLSRHYGIGMSPLREALARLVGDSLVVTEGQRGCWVSPLSAEEFEDITATRGLVETQALHLSIERGDDAWEAQVRAAYAALGEVERRMLVEEGLMDAFEEANRLFHEAIISACESPWLLKFAAALYQQSARYRRISLASVSPVRSVQDEHGALAEATLARQSLKACRLLERHLNGTAEVVGAALAQNQSKLRLVAS